ncbi:hypothetical protein [uncultured Mediterranean phage uvMED]|nr:hypothetical protein [uncultured Mediterranean phage uvMED]
MGVSAISLGLGLGGGKSATSSGSPGGGGSGFNVTTRDTEANILASTPSNPSGQVNIAFGTDTKDFYIYNGSTWNIIFNTP